MLATLALAAALPALPDEEFRTLRVGVVAYEGVEMLDLAGPVEVFAAAGGRLRIDGHPLFEVVVVAPQPGKVTSMGCVTIEPAFTCADAPPIDLLVIPGGEIGALDDAKFRA